MQDRYTGDIGDFSKFGLLRWLCGVREVDSGRRLRLGILWYLFGGRDPAGGNDGGLIQYLFSPSRAESPLAACDPYLHQQCGRLVTAIRRTVDDVPISGVLPPDTLYHGEPLSFDKTPLAERPAKRAAWIADAHAAVADADVVCLDPDNGMEVAGVGRHSAKGPKYAYYDDLAPLWERGQSLVIYQHAARQGSVEAQARDRLDKLAGALPGAALRALRFNRRSVRVYVVAAQPHHADLVRERIDSFLASGWGTGANPHFSEIAR